MNNCCEKRNSLHSNVNLRKLISLHEFIESHGASIDIRPWARVLPWAKVAARCIFFGQTVTTREWLCQEDTMLPTAAQACQK